LNSAVLLRRRTWYVRAMLLVAVMSGVRAGVLPRGQQNTDLAIMLAAGIVSTLLLDADSRLRGQGFPKEARWLIALVWPAVVVVYAVTTRGLRGLWIVAKYLVFASALYLAAVFASRFVAFRFYSGIKLP